MENASLKKKKIITKSLEGMAFKVNKRGQALVEFVIILPIFILLVLGVIDMGRIMYSKMNLEEQLSDVVDYYKSGKTIDEIKNKYNLDSNNIKIDVKGEYVDIKLSKDIDIITPGLQLFLGNPYSIEAFRSILNE